MSGITRRDALQVAAVGAAFAAARTSLAADEKGDEKTPKPYSDLAAERWKDHKTATEADLKEVFRKTEPYKLKVGILTPDKERAVPADAAMLERRSGDFGPMGVNQTADAWGSPRPDLNGLRVKMPNRPEIYLIDRGYRRWIPNPDTYNNLFRDWNGVVIDININEIPQGSQISYGAVLARGNGTAPVFLIDQGMKRWITSPAIMDQYYFNWSRVYVVAPAVVYSIPSGPDINS